MSDNANPEATPEAEATPSHIDSSFAAHVPSGTMAAEVAAELPASDQVPGPGNPLVSDDQAFKDAFRRNARWCLVETQMIQSGRSESERAHLNP